MIFYYAITNYHILNCILHKLKYHSKESSILYLSKWHPEHEFLIKKISKLNFFDEVHVFDEVTFPSGNKHISKEQIREDINYIVNNIPDIDFSLYKEINVCGDHYGLGVYLVYHQINYNYFEDGCGILSNEELLMDNIKKIEYSRYQILNSLKIPGNARCVSNRFGNLKKQSLDYKNKKDIHFSVVDELKNLSKINLKKILTIFCDNYQIKKYEDSALVLTFHYANLGILSLNEQRLFYGYLIDYFAKDRKIVIKPHPSDSQSKYEEWFPQVNVLPRKLPSEFLALLVSKKFPLAITGWSTSINNLSDILDEVINFNQEIDKTYFLMNQYYLIGYVIHEIFNTGNIDIFGKNINEMQLVNILKIFDMKNFKINNYCNLKKCCDDTKFHIIIYHDYCYSKDDVLKSVNQLKDNEIIFFIFDKMINFDEIFEILCKDIKLLKIEKEILDNNLEIPSDFLQLEYVLYATKNCDLMNITEKVDFIKDLKYTNVRLKVTGNLIHIIRDSYLKKNLEINNLEEENKKLLFVNKDFEQQIFDKNNLLNELQKRYDEILTSSSWKITAIYRKIGLFVKKGLKKFR